MPPWLSYAGTVLGSAGCGFVIGSFGEGVLWPVAGAVLGLIVALWLAPRPG